VEQLGYTIQQEPHDPNGGVPLSKKADNQYRRLVLVAEWHRTLVRPEGIEEKQYPGFMRQAVGYFLDKDRLWKKDQAGQHRLVIWVGGRLRILQSAHDDLAHKGLFAIRSMIAKRFWWPQMSRNIAWFVKTCHLCQIRQVQQVLIPPVVAMPAPLFAKMYMDAMHLPPSSGYRYVVQGRCSVSHYPEFKALRSQTGDAIAKWIFEDIICRWGCLMEIVTDNGTPFLSAMAPLAKRYHINHIRISGYNSRANGIAERPHFDVRQGLFKAASGDQSKWYHVLHSVFWADRVTTRRRMGCSPYYAATGTHPLLPFDISEVTYLLPPPDGLMTSTDLIARRAIALQKRSEDLLALHSKVYETRIKAAKEFETRHFSTIRDYNFRRGRLVIARHTEIEKSLNRKMRPRYLGPLIVISRNKGGAYILCELDGTLLDRPIAAFRLLPYFAREAIVLPDIACIDMTTDRLEEMEKSKSDGMEGLEREEDELGDDEEEGPDLNMPDDD
jgi:hypothetical protein